MSLNLDSKKEVVAEITARLAKAQTVVLADGSMEILASDIASGLLSGNSNPPTVYSLVSTVFLERPGCLQIWAMATREGAAIPLYQGSLVISAR